ncbi:cation:proton antiporter [Aurantimonas sp. Leaf443]|uniref:cation:proton antiporter n=1 Tax=Aurantimonas sp. Leaf443 TaxID=1736378 RepID=UPI0006F327EA|nr:cation:proton antiporter [Aurantimonas sp. Leaf443]KQT85982.1 hypothetical protein ASG48_05160 [Aurantimonas sp. Leaf443]
MSFHEFSGHVLDFAVFTALILLSLAFLVTLMRIVKGPTLPDRALGLDMLTAIAIGFIAVFGLSSGFTLYVDIAIALGLVGFLATVAFARFVIGVGGPGRDPAGASILFDEPRLHRRRDRVKARFRR